MSLINPMDRTKYGISRMEAYEYYMNRFPTCYWGFPVNEIKVAGKEGFEEWWEGDNGWWYTVMNPEAADMRAITVCIPYWGA